MDVYFAVDGSNSFHKLEPGKTLIRFTEFDFTFFWEQCIEIGRNARKTGRISHNMNSAALTAVSKCHPYVAACAGTDFSNIVIDCIIAYICHSEGIGLEDLWVRCISPKSLYEKEIFERVSEYKTGRGINQWVNIVRMQEYARSKMNFIYECEGNVMVRREDYRARREYFDLSFLVAANETGCPMKELPSVKKYSPSLLPGGAFMLGNIAKNVYRRIADSLESAERVHDKHLTDHNRDRTALDAFGYVKDMPRPERIDMSFVADSLSAVPEEVYLPDSFKAAVDLEFEELYRQGIYLSRCPGCGKFFIRDIAQMSPYCRRVNSSGSTCADVMEKELSVVARSSDAPKADEIDSNEPAKRAENGAFPKEPVPDNFVKTPIEIPSELERRCQKVYSLVSKRAGRFMTGRDFEEWTAYLNDSKRDIREGNADIKQLEDFLDYWESVVKTKGRKKKPVLPPKEPTAEELLNEAAKDIPLVTEDVDMGAVDDETAARVAKELLDDFGDEVIIDAEIIHEEFLPEGASGISPAGVMESGDIEGGEQSADHDRIYKPFAPPKYNTVLEAMMDGKYRSDEILKGGDTETDEITVRGKKITLPKWERINKGQHPDGDGDNV